MKKREQTKNPDPNASFPWFPVITTNIITGLVVGVVIWFLQDHAQRKQREIDIATSIAITAANDLQTSTGVSETTRARLFEKGKIGNYNSLFAAVYSPTVNLPAASDTAILQPNTLSALDDYRKRIFECNKHRGMLIEEWRQATPSANTKGLLLAYCVSLDSVVRTGLNLLQAIETEYPPVMKNIIQPPQYRILELDLKKMETVLLDPKS